MRALILCALLVACESPEEQNKRLAREAWEAPCADVSTLLATTSGSPSQFRCPNREHEMQFQVATAASNEEAAALVVCKCRGAK